MRVVNVFLRKHFSFLYHVLRKANRDDVWGMAAEIAFQLCSLSFRL